MVCFAWTGGVAEAQRDVPAETAELAVEPLPTAPEGYVRERHGDVTWEFHELARSVARDLQEAHRTEWPRVVAELGAEVDGALTIRIGRNPEEMAALAPRRAPPPPYASGVAYPHRGLVLLTLAAPETWERPDVESVLVHELSHVALHRAVNGHPVPRWFTEGVAIYQAREHSFERVQTLWNGTASGTLLPMRRLEAGFPAEPHRVSLAYAQSADFVRWLRARDDGEARFHELIRRLRTGQSFENGLEVTYSISPGSLEIEWLDGLSERFQAWPLLLGGSGLWGIAVVLVVLGYVRRKRQSRAKLREWEAEEASLDESEDESDDTPVVVQRPPLTALPLIRDDEDRELLYVVPPEPRFRETGVPTVEHDGRSHTLH
jgi:hypothetical protein